MNPSAAIFDMDGLLIDSEPLWWQAEIEVFATVGIPLTTADCHQTMGMHIDAVVAHWYQRYPCQGAPQQQIADEIIARVTELVTRQGALMPGAERALRLCADAGLPLALCSSSPPSMITAVLQRFALGELFSHWHSGAEERHSKPHPAVYITTATLLGVAPDRCLALEDSLPGCVAAKAARMHVIAVPGQSAPPQQFAFCDRVLDSLALLEPRHLSL